MGDSVFDLLPKLLVTRNSEQGNTGDTFVQLFVSRILNKPAWKKKMNVLISFETMNIFHH